MKRQTVTRAVALTAILGMSASGMMNGSFVTEIRGEGAVVRTNVNDNRYRVSYYLDSAQAADVAEVKP